MDEEPVLDAWVIIVRLWWEQAGGGEVAMRARVTATAGDAVARSVSGASTVEGVVAAVRAATDRFMAAGPAVGDGYG